MNKIQGNNTPETPGSGHAKVHDGSSIVVPCGNQKWYIAECKPTRERVIRKMLEADGHEVFVASQLISRIYKSRNRRIIERIIIPGRVFVRTNERQLMGIMLAHAAISRFMLNRAATPCEHGRQPFASVTEQEMQRLRYMLDKASTPVHLTAENLVLGQEVEVMRGALAGLRGQLSRIDNASCIVIKMEMGTRHYIYTEISLDDVQPVQELAARRDH